MPRRSQAGDPAVGKTAIVQMFHSAGQRFPKHYMMTLGVEFCVKAVTLQDADTSVEFHLFDTAGQVPPHEGACAARGPGRQQGKGARAAPPPHAGYATLAPLLHATQDIYAEMVPSFWEDAEAVILVYDVTRAHTLEACANWYGRLLQTLGKESLPGLLVANKMDLRERLVVKRAEGQQMASQLGLQVPRGAPSTTTGSLRAQPQLS